MDAAIRAETNRQMAEGRMDAKTYSNISLILQRKEGIVEEAQKALEADGEYTALNMQFMGADPVKDPEGYDNLHRRLTAVRNRILKTKDVDAQLRQLDAALVPLFQQANVPVVGGQSAVPSSSGLSPQALRYLQEK
jgi:hypothetical protein